MSIITSVLKYIVLFVNLIFFFLGCCIVATATFMYSKDSLANTFDLFGKVPLSSAIVLIIIGGIVSAISLLGCCGATIENRCMMKSYATIVLILLLIEISGIFTIMIYRNEMKQVLSTQLKQGLDRFEFDEFTVSNGKRYEGLTAIWNSLQQEYQCCGVEGPNDWKDTPFGTTFPNMLPDSCCKMSINTNECWAHIGGKYTNNFMLQGV